MTIATDFNDKPRLPWSWSKAAGKTLIYVALLTWAFICLFPIFWTVTTSFKNAINVTQGDIIPFIGRFQGDWKGWRSLGLSPDTIFEISTVRDEFLLRYSNSLIASVGAALLAVIIGAPAAYGLARFRYRFGPWRNKDISFFFLSQLLLPPVVLAMPFLVLYKQLAMLDNLFGLIMIYTLMVLPIVIWITRDQFETIPIELEQAALVDGCTVWGHFSYCYANRPAGSCGRIHSVCCIMLERIFLCSTLDEYQRENPTRHGRESDRLARDQLVDNGRPIDRCDCTACVYRRVP